MEIIWIVLIALGWYCTGCFSFVYWTTRDFDLKVKDVPLVLFAGFAGLIMWVIGWAVLGDKLTWSFLNKVIKKCR